MWHGSLAAAGCTAWVHAFTNGGHASAQKEMSFSTTFPLLVRWLQCRRCTVLYCLSATERGAVPVLPRRRSQLGALRSCPSGLFVWSWHSKCIDSLHVLTQSYATIFQCPGVSANQLLLWTYIRPQHSDLMWHGSRASAGCSARMHAFTNSGHPSALKRASASRSRCW